MATQVRVNRDHAKHLWTVFSLTHHHRIGRANGLLLAGVTFVREGESGWADGELWSWAEMQLDAKFHERLEQRTVDYLSLVWVPLLFRNGQFFVAGREDALTGGAWVRIVGRGAWIALPSWSA